MGRLIDETDLINLFDADDRLWWANALEEIRELPIVEVISKADVENILDEIRTELYATAEMHDDGDYYLREEWIGEIFDNVRRRHEICR